MCQHGTYLGSQGIILGSMYGTLSRRLLCSIHELPGKVRAQELAQNRLHQGMLIETNAKSMIMTQNIPK